MGTELIVDTGVLQRSANTLGVLCSKFEGTDAMTAQNSEAIGSKEMSAALHEFATNWDYHKHCLVKQLTSIQQMAQKGSETYEAIERDLAAALKRGAS